MAVASGSNTVVATGFFDGVHIGHRLVIERLVQAAEERGEESLVVTFWPHPRTVLQQEARTFRLLSSMQEKKALLSSLGVDRIEVIPFTREFGSMTTAAYLEFLMDRFRTDAIVLGYDNRMGSDARDSAGVRLIAEELGLEAITVGKRTSDAGIGISSTKIRSCSCKRCLFCEGADSRQGFLRHVQHRKPSYCQGRELHYHRDEYLRL